MACVGYGCKSHSSEKCDESRDVSFHRTANLVEMSLAAKVKKHGIKDERWLIKDKIAQYRGINALFERDRKLFKCDVVQCKKRYSRDIQKFRTEIYLKRDKLDIAVFGDKQFLRTVLQDHRRLQLAYMNSHADKVLESIRQNNFNKKKQLDRMDYIKKKKLQNFRKLQLEAAEVRDRILYEANVRHPTLRREQVVSNNVQSANIRKNAALAIQALYRKMLDILKKDSYYFTVVLNALQSDCATQGKCLLRATEMGQLAMEYLDDRKFEYNRLEAEVKLNMKERQMTLIHVRKELHFLMNSFVGLIAKDTSGNLDDLYEGSSEGSAHSVHWELEDVLATCKELQRDLRVSSFDDMLPRLKELRYQSERLTNQLISNRIILDAHFINRQHALFILDSLKNKGQEETSKYIEEKRKIRSNMAVERKIAEKFSQAKVQKGDLLFTMREALLHIYYLLSCVGLKTQAKGHSPRKETPAAVQYALDDVMKAVAEVESNSDKMISTSKQKLNMLVLAVSKIDVTPGLKYASKNLYQDVVMQILRNDYKEEVVVEAAEHALVDFEMDDPDVPNHDMVKLRSKQLVDAQVSEFDVPDYAPK